MVVEEIDGPHFGAVGEPQLLGVGLPQVIGAGAHETFALTSSTRAGGDEPGPSEDGPDRGSRRRARSSSPELGSDPSWSPVGMVHAPVSYTHLRAHETKANL